MELAAILGMVAVVCTLAVLQYRWTAEIGRSERTALEGDADDRRSRVRSGIFRTISSACAKRTRSIRKAIAENLEARVLRQHEEWTRIASRPNLLAGLLIWKTGGAAPLSSPARSKSREAICRVSLAQAVGRPATISLGPGWAGY